MVAEVILSWAVIYLVFSLGNYLNAKAIEARSDETPKSGSARRAKARARSDLPK